MSENENNSNLPKGIDQKVFDTAKAIIVSGFNADQNENDIKSAMFSKGIAFSDLVRLYKSITISEGLVKSAKEIKDEISKIVVAAVEKLINGKNNEDLTFDMFLPVITKCLKVSGATEKRAVAAIRSELNDFDMEMPTKPKAAKGRSASKINTVVADLFAGNKTATEAEFKTAIEAVTTEKSAKKWLRMFKLFSAIANGVNAEAGLK